MDVANLKFLPSSFDVAASFFSLMYIENDDHLKVFNEVYRVLKDQGRFLKWDVGVPERFEDKRFFIIPLETVLPNEKVEARYRVKLDQQDLEYLKGLARKSGFEVVIEWEKGDIFFLELLKNYPKLHLKMVRGGFNN